MALEIINMRYKSRQQQQRIKQQENHGFIKFWKYLSSVYYMTNN